jgi:hypothetical protein
MNPHFKTMLIVIGLIFVALILWDVAHGEEAQAQPIEYGCQTYGCLYAHDRGYWTRDGYQEHTEYGIAHEHLPDGPDGRSFERVLWPEGYHPDRRPMWDQVAHCESTMRWHIATGNGYYGGLQFSSSTWRAYGGGQYAGYAHHATPEQQIAIAENVLREGYGPHGPQGRGAWPHCGRNLW